MRRRVLLSGLLGGIVLIHWAFVANAGFGLAAVPVIPQGLFAENRFLASRSARGRVEVRDTVGHGMNDEAPGAVADAIRRFMNGLSIR